jgi:hypothetical protein
MAIERLSGGLTPADGSDPRTFPTIFNEAADFIENGFRFAGTRYFTSSGTFVKADPLGTGDIGCRAVRVRMVGGGGGSGSCRATGASQGSGSGGGGGGAYSESFILASALTSSVTVTRGAGGAGGTAPDTAGSDGGASEFGVGTAFEVSAPGGVGSAFSLARTVPTSPASPGVANDAGTGDFAIAGSPGSSPYIFATEGTPGAGGASFLSPERGTTRSASGTNGLAGRNFGGGARGSINIPDQADARNGSAGAPGIVIVEVYV